MSVVSLKSDVRTNEDGLRIWGPASAQTLTRGGELVSADGKHCSEVYIPLASVAAYDSGNQTIVSENVAIPAGAFIEKVEIFVTKETAGSNANLDIGLVRTDRSTELDFNGLITAGDDFNGGTDLGASYSYVKGTTDAGALVGTKLAYTGILTANAETANFSAGVIRVRVYWSIPHSNDV